MIRNAVILLVVISFFVVGQVQAQPESGWGIGISVVDIHQIFEFGASEGSAYNHSIIVPIVMSQSFRLEPEIGFYNGKNTWELQGNKEEYTATQYRFGLGIFPQSAMKSSTIYYGARIGYLSLKLKEEETFGGVTQTDEYSTSGFFIAPAVGGEYFFSNSFSLGAEAQVMYASLSSEIEGSDVDISDTLISTRGLVFIRFFF